MKRQAIRPADVVRTADLVVSALTPGIGKDWSVRAGKLEWDVGFTVTHIAAALSKYTLYLASRSTRFIAMRLEHWPDASQTERLDSIALAARALDHVAEVSPPGTRAYHATGMFDPEGYVALGCVELLVHAHDVATGLELLFEPSDDVCRAVVARSFPWLVDGGPAWETILWQTGRVDIDGRPSHDDDTWTLLAEPLSEWDGEIPADDPGTVVEWIPDDGGWRPRYLEDDRS